MEFSILMALAFLAIAWSLFRSRHDRVALREARASYIGSFGLLTALLIMRLDGPLATIAGASILLPSVVVSLRASRARLAKRYSAPRELPSGSPVSAAEALLRASDAEDLEEARRRMRRRYIVAAVLPTLGIAGIVGWRLSWQVAALTAIPMLIVNGATFLYVGQALRKKSVTGG